MRNTRQRRIKERSKERTRRDNKRKMKVRQGEFIVIPKGKVHRPIAEKEAHVMLFVTSENVNTGDKINEFTKNEIERI